MRLREIEQRLAAIRTELETRSNELTADAITALENEVNELVEERTQLLQAQERRNTLLNQIAGNSNTPAEPTQPQPTVLRSFGAGDGSNGGAADADGDVYGGMNYRRAFMAYVTRGTAIPAEFRSNNVTKTTDVGAAVPTTVLNKIVSKMESVGGIYALVTKTAYKGGVSIPKQTLKPVATWVAEGTGSDKQKIVVGNVTFAYHKLRCAVSVSFETDTMAIDAFETLLVNNIVEAMVKAIEKAIIAGTGSGQPTGIINSDEYAEIVSVGTLGYDTLVAAEAAIPEAYEATAKWCMSKKTFMSFVGLVDKQGQPIARVNYGVSGRPERYLFGREVQLTEHLPNFTAAEENAKFAFIFDFTNYDLNTNYAIGIKRYEDNDTDDQVTKGIMLADGKVVDGNGLVILKKIKAA